MIALNCKSFGDIPTQQIFRLLCSYIFDLGLKSFSFIFVKGRRVVMLSYPKVRTPGKNISFKAAKVDASFASG